MKINVYYFIVGLLSLLFGVTHALNGINNYLPVINATNIDLAIKITSLYVWHIISIENIIFGVAFLFMAFRKDPRKTMPIAWIIAIIIIARWLVISVSTALIDLGSVGNMLIDSIAIIIYVGLIILGIRKGHTSIKTQ